jgi:hypothetical protein
MGGWGYLFLFFLTSILPWAHSHSKYSKNDCQNASETFSENLNFQKFLGMLPQVAMYTSKNLSPPPHFYYPWNYTMSYRVKGMQILSENWWLGHNTPALYTISVYEHDAIYSVIIIK